MKRIIPWTLVLVTALIAGLFIVATRLDTPDIAAPADGPGYAEAALTVATRSIPLPVHVWYPAEAGGTPEWLGRNALFFGHAVRRGAPPASGTHPVALVSHGSGGSGPRMGWLARALVQDSWVVIAPDHPGTTSGDSLPAETVKVWQRTDDLIAVDNALANVLPEGLTTSDIRVSVGFSLGGHTALALGGARVSKDGFIADCAARDDYDCGWLARGRVDLTQIDAARYEADLSLPGLDGVVVIDPALSSAMTEDSLAALDVPVLLLNLGDPTPAAMRADRIATFLPDARLDVIADTGHFAMLPECAPLGDIILGLSLRADENICASYAIPRSAVQADVAARVVAFLSDLR